MVDSYKKSLVVDCSERISIYSSKEKVTAILKIKNFMCKSFKTLPNINGYWYVISFFITLTYLVKYRRCGTPLEL